MRISDHLEFSCSNLWNMKLRTILTTLGVVVGIGALVSMISFGRGMQKNVTDAFEDMELFNSITVFADSSREQPASEAEIPLDEAVIAEIEGMRGVRAVFPEVRFPALVSLNEREEFRLVQVIPVKVATSKLMKMRYGRPYLYDDEHSVIVSDMLLKRLKVKDISSVIGKKIEVSSLSFDFETFNPLDLPKILLGEKLPFAKEKYEFTVVGITERMAFGGPAPLRSDVFIPPATAEGIKKLPFTGLLELFRFQSGKRGFSVVNVRVASPKFVESVKTRIQEKGFRTFALIDQLEEIKTGFLYLDMILFAVGMIALVVASLGIINTMVMSIMERYNEIGIMKAVGASDRDVKKIFFFESSAIGFLGGVFGLGLGWVVSRIINQIVNFFLSKQEVPYIDNFSFP